MIRFFLRKVNRIGRIKRHKAKRGLFFAEILTNGGGHGIIKKAAVKQAAEKK